MYPRTYCLVCTCGTHNLVSSNKKLHSNICDCNSVIYLSCTLPSASQCSWLLLAAWFRIPCIHHHKLVLFAHSRCLYVTFSRVPSPYHIVSVNQCYQCAYDVVIYVSCPRCPLTADSSLAITQLLRSTEFLLYTLMLHCNIVTLLLQCNHWSTATEWPSVTAGAQKRR